MPKKTKKKSRTKPSRPRPKALKKKSRTRMVTNPMGAPVGAVGVSSLSLRNPARPFQALPGRNHPKWGMSARFVGCDLVDTIVQPANNSAGAILSNVLIAPIQFAGTRLATLATLWERFKFNTARFLYVPSLSTLTGGSVAAYCDYDCTDDLTVVPAALRPTRVAASMGSSATQVWQSMATDLKYVDAMQDWYTDDEATDPASLRLQNQGQYWMILQNAIPAASYAAGGVMGSLYVEYDIEFFIPQVDDSASNVSALSYNLLKNGVYSTLGYESQSIWYGLVAAEIDNISGALEDPNRNQGLAPQVTLSYGPLSAYVQVNVSNYVGCLRWSGYGSTNDGPNIVGNVLFASRQAMAAVNPITVTTGNGHLDQTAGGVTFGGPWVPNTRDYPQAIADPYDQGISGTVAAGQVFTPTMDWDTTNAVTGNTCNQAQFSFITVSVGGNTTVRFNRSQQTEGTLYWQSAYLSVDTIGPTGPNVNANNVPSLMLAAQRARHRALVEPRYHSLRINKRAAEVFLDGVSDDEDDDPRPIEPPIVLHDFNTEYKLAKTPIDSRDGDDNSNPIVIVTAKEAEEYARWKNSSRHPSAPSIGNTATFKVL